MEKNAVAHAQQINTFFPVILTVVYPFNREVIEERFNRVMKRYAMVTPVCFGFDVVPFTKIALQDGADYQLSPIFFGVFIDAEICGHLVPSEADFDIIADWGWVPQLGWLQVIRSGWRPSQGLGRRLRGRLGSRRSGSRGFEVVQC